MTEVIKATQKLTRASDCRDDTKNLMQPYANWEEYITPGPISIAILGELVFISSKTDFSINKNPPKDGFKFIKYPESFRACLMQVCNAGWGAFNEAHKSMDLIRLHTASVPEYIQTSVKILMQDNNELIQTLLPDQLENIDHIAIDCLQLAEKTENKFTFVIELIQELLEACVNAKQCYGEELENIKRKIEETKLREKASLEANKRAKQAFENMNQQLDQAQNRFTESINSMPSGWEMIGMNFVEGVSQTVTSVLSNCANVMCGGIFLSANDKFTNKPGTGQSQNVSAGQNTATNDPFSANNILSQSDQLLKLTQSIGVFVDGNKIKWSEIYDQKTTTCKTDHLKTVFDTIKLSITKENECEPKQFALDICAKATSICTDLSALAPEGKSDDSKTKQLIDCIRGVIQLAQQFDCKSKVRNNSPAFSISPPQLSQTQSSTSAGKSAGQIAAENAHLHIEQSRYQLDKVREMYQRSVENMEKNQQELTEILVTMRSCEVKEIDFNTTIKMLVKGLDALGRVKEQWEKMVRFFQMISNIIKSSLSQTLKDFVQTVSRTSQCSLPYNSRMFVVDIIYQKAFFASNISSLVNMIAGTYFEVSDKYLMDRVSSLGKLMALDPSQPEFNTERGKLESGCQEAEEGIRHLILKNKRSFDNKTKARLEKIERELKAVLPPASEKETQKIKAIVAAEFNDNDLSQFA